MATDGPLTAQDLERLDTLGYVKVRAFAATAATAMEDAIWRRLEAEGVTRDDPSTWNRPTGLSRNVRNSRAFREAMGAEFAAMVDQLLGPGRWRRPKDCGTLLYTFPQDRDGWDVARHPWHWHGDPLRNLDGLRDIFIFCFLSRVEPQGGGTVLIEGSHRVTTQFIGGLTPEQRRLKVKNIKQKFFASDPWLRALVSKKHDPDRRQRFMDRSTDVAGVPLRVVELTGEPGEAYITNMSTMHCTSFNILDKPRFMTAAGISQLDAGRQPGD